MNIQIFGTKKCNDTKKAERFFKERGIKYQFIDMKEKGMSKGEFNSVAQVNGGLENMINWDGKDKDVLALIKYTADEDKLEKVLENPQVIKTPVVRNGKQTPTKGHPVFIAQHATATCCRECIRKWHKMQPGKELSKVQQDYLVDVIMTWIEKELARAKEN